MRLINDHTFEWLGRYDNVINSGGVKIHSEQLESVISKIFEDMDISNRFFCIGIPDKTLGQKVALIIEGDLDINESVILDRIKSATPKFHSPKVILNTKHFEETETGKVKRKAITEKVISGLP